MNSLQIDRASKDTIEIVGGRVNNLKNISLSIPKYKIIAITGVSGSGKSSLAFDLLYEEGRMRYLQAIGFPPRVEQEKPFDILTGLSPTIAVEQRTVRNQNPRSTVGTRTSIYNYMRMLFASEAEYLCPICKVLVDHDLTCSMCGMKVKRLEIKHFSFNEPSGMCLNCKGRGYIRQFRIEKLIPNPNLNIMQICAEASGSFADLRVWLPNLAEFYEFDVNTPYKNLPKKIQDIFLYGSKETKIPVRFQSKQYEHFTEKIYEGVIPHLERAMEKSVSEFRRKKIEKNYMDKIICPECNGFRINDQARSGLIGGKHIGELAHLTIEELIAFFEQTNLKQFNTSNGKALVTKILDELRKFRLIGLSYLHLNRPLVTLSGGENQRLSLLHQMTLGLNNVVIILDEPTMGMHELEKKSLRNILQQIRNQGNTILLVEHDESLIRSADEIIDLGPGAGILGGQVVYQGPLQGIFEYPQSLTGKYLSGKLSYPTKTANQRRTTSKSVKKQESYLQMVNISTNNLRNINVDIPLGLLVGICGMSGSGKSSLIADTLVPLIHKHLISNRKKNRQDNQKSDKTSKVELNEIDESEEHETFSEDESEPLDLEQGELKNWDQLEDCIVVDQSPIGRNRNSFPASYIGLWDYIRKLFAQQPLAKQRKYNEGHFSFNSDKGRCPQCKGEGKVNLRISFLDELTVVCEECDGQRYLPEILDVKYAGKNIRQILDLSVTEAISIFKDEPKILNYCQILQEIGMGYITLGQPATTLSGGEAQRVKLAKALGAIKQRKTLFVLDEPSTGLHFDDERKLLILLDKLVDQGNSVIVIEHNPKILNFCDWLIELGPEGGPKGGQIIAEGAPETVKMSPKSIIGKYLQ